MTKIARLANAASPGGRKKKDNKHTHRSGSSTAKSLQQLQFSLRIFGGWWIQKVILDMATGDLEMAITLWFPRGSPQRQRWYFRKRDLTTCNGKRRLRNPCLLLSVIYCNLIRYHGCMHQKGDKQPLKWHLLTSTAWGGWLLQNSLVFPSLIPRWIPRFAGEVGG